jgi:predicted MFS family arabinose efflux permease
LGGLLVDHLGWRHALLALAVGGGVATAVVHALVLPPAQTVLAPPEPAPPGLLATKPVRQLQTALLFEQAAIIATTAHLIGLLVDRGATLAVAGAVLGAMGIGKVVGRLLLLGPTARRVPLAGLAAGCNVVQLAGLALPLATTATGPLVAVALVVGAASGATTVLRPLLVVELVGAGPFAAVSGHLQRATTFARAAAPLAIGLGAASIGWPLTWTIALATFGVAAERYLRLDRATSTRSRRGDAALRPVDVADA